MFARENRLTFLRYWSEFSECKNLAQWKARANAISVPVAGTMAIRIPCEAGRLLALKSIADSDDVVSANLRPKEQWVIAELAAWMEA